MADYKGLNIKFEADETSATKGLYLIGESAKSAQAQLTAMQTALKNLATNGDALNATLKSIQLEALGDQASAARSKFDAYSQLLPQLQTNLDGLREKLATNKELLASMPEKYTAFADTASESFSRVKQAMDDLAAAREAVETAPNQQAYVQAVNDQVDAQMRLNAAVADGDEAFRQVSTTYGTLEGRINSLEEQERAAAENVKRTTTNMYEAESAANALEARFTALTAVTEASQTSMYQFGESAKELGSGLQTAGDALSSIGDKMTVVSGVVLATFGRNVISSTEEFGNAISQLGGYLDISGTQLNAMSDEALKWGKETKFSATEAADAMNELAKGGMSQVQITGGAMKATLDLAAAGQLNMASAAETTVQAIKTFGLEAEDATQVADALAGGANKSTAEVSDLAAGFKYAGAQAALAGWDINEVSGALALMADHGLRGEMAGTALANVMKRLATPTDTAAAVMEQYNIQVRNADGTMKGAVEIVQELQNKLGGLNDEAKSNALNDIFQTRGLVGAVALLEEGADKFQTYIDATKQAGYASEMAENSMGELGWALELLRGEAETAMVTLGNALTPTIKGMAEALEHALEWFNNLDSGTQTFIANMGLAAVSVGPLLSVVGHLASGIGGMISTVGTAAETIATFAQLAKGGGDTVTLFAEAVATATTPMSDTAAGMEQVIAKAAGLEQAFTSLATGAWVTALGAVIAGLWGQFADFHEHAAIVADATTNLSDALENAETRMSSMSESSGAFNAFKALSEAADESREALKSVGEYTDEINDKFTSLGGEHTQLEEYVSTIEDLSGKSGITADEIAILRDAVSRYNDITSSAVQITNDQTGALNVQPQAIREVAAAYEDMMRARAYSDLLYDAIKKQAEVEQELADVTDEYTSIQEKYSIKLGDTGWEISTLIGGALDDYRELAANKEALEKSNERLIESIEHWRDKVGEAGDAEQAYNELLRELGLVTDDDSEALDNLADSSDGAASAQESLSRAIEDATTALKRQNDAIYTQAKRDAEDAYNAKKAELDASYDQTKSALDREYQLQSDAAKRAEELMKSENSKAEDELKKYLDSIYDQKKDEFSREYDLAKDAYSDEYDALKKSLDKRYNEIKSSLDKEYKAQRDAYSKQLSALKSQHSAEESELKKSLDKEYNVRRKAADKEYKQWQKENQRLLKEAKKANTAETDAFKAATKERIAAIKAEYEEKKRLYELNDGTAEIDAQIKAIEDEQEAEDAARKQAEREEKKADLERAVRQAKTRRARQDAEAELSEYLNQLAEEDADAERERQIQALKERKEQIAEQTDAEKDRLDEERDQRIAAYQQQRDEELAALEERQDAAYELLSEKLNEQLELRKEKQQEELQDYRDQLNGRLEVMRDQHAAEQQAMSDWQAAELESLKDRQSAYLESVKESNADTLANLKDEQSAALENMRILQEAELANLKADQEAELQAAKDINAENLRQLQETNDQALRDLKDSNDQILDGVKASNSQVLQSLKRDQEDSLGKLKQDQEDAVRDLKRSMEDGAKSVEENSGKAADAIKKNATASTSTIEAEGTKQETSAKSTTEEISGLYNKLMGDAHGFVTTKMPQITSTFETEGGKQKGIVRTDSGEMKSLYNDLFDQFGTKSRSVMPQVTSTISTEMGNQANEVDASTKRMDGSYSALFDSLEPKATGAMGNLANGIQIGGQQAESTAGDVANGIRDKFNGLDNDLNTAGYNAGIGLNNGLAETAGTIYDTAATIAEGIRNTINSVMEIHSPSKALYKSGRYGGLGLQKGFEDSERDIMNVARNLADELSETISVEGDLTGLRDCAQLYVNEYRDMYEQVEELTKYHLASMERLTGSTLGYGGSKASLSIDAASVSRQVSDAITSAMGNMYVSSAPTIIVQSMTVRQESDIREISRELHRLQQQGERRSVRC